MRTVTSSRAGSAARLHRGQDFRGDRRSALALPQERQASPRPPRRTHCRRQRAGRAGSQPHCPIRPTIAGKRPTQGRPHPQQQRVQQADVERGVVGEPDVRIAEPERETSAHDEPPVPGEQAHRDEPREAVRLHGPACHVEHGEPERHGPQPGPITRNPRSDTRSKSTGPAPRRATSPRTRAGRGFNSIDVTARPHSVGVSSAEHDLEAFQVAPS